MSDSSVPWSSSARDARPCPPGFLDPTVVRAGSTARCWSPFRPLSADAVAFLLALLGVGPASRFVDLGSGDGRVVTAAAALGATAVGIESDRRLVGVSRRRLADAGLRGRARICHAPLDAVPLDGCTHVFAWLLPWAYTLLMPILSGVSPLMRACFVGIDVPPSGRLLWRFVPAVDSVLPPAVVCVPWSPDFVLE